MSWQRVFNNPADEREQFKRAVKRAQKLLKWTAEGVGEAGHWTHKDWEKVERAISKAEHLARYVEEPEREEAYALRSQFRPALDAGAEARSRAWAEERKQLTQKIREAQPIGFEKELALLKGRR